MVLEFHIYFSSDHIFYAQVTLLLPGKNKTRYHVFVIVKQTLY
jgi:hypothetical protein